MRSCGRLLSRPRSLAVLTAALAAVLGAAATPVAARPSAPPTPGAADIGDPLFPGLGNGGYDVRHYTLDLDYATTAAVQTVPARVTIDARATQALSRFDLDFSGDSVAVGQVDGRPAAFAREGEELVITPARRSATTGGSRSRVAYTSGPREIGPADAGDLNKVLAIAWFATPSGSITAAQPNCAHRIFPSNDVPSDPATYTFRAVTPAGSTFVANGELHRQADPRRPHAWDLRGARADGLRADPAGLRRLTVERARLRARRAPARRRADQPIAALEPALVRAPRPPGLHDRQGRPLPVPRPTARSSPTRRSRSRSRTRRSRCTRSFLFLPAADHAVRRPALLRADHGARAGPHVVRRRRRAGALERPLAQRGPRHLVRVGVRAGARRPGLLPRRHRSRSRCTPPTPRATSCARLRARSPPRATAPTTSPRCSARTSTTAARSSCSRCGRRSGDARSATSSGWPQRYGGSPASTADFIALASEVAGPDLTAFLTDWLYGTTTPPMPGHPDWTVDPVGPPATKAARPAPTLARSVLLPDFRR